MMMQKTISYLIGLGVVLTAVLIFFYTPLESSEDTLSGNLIFQCLILVGFVAVLNYFMNFEHFKRFKLPLLILFVLGISGGLGILIKTFFVAGHVSNIGMLQFITSFIFLIATIDIKAFIKKSKE